MTSAIVATLPGRVEAATHDRAERKPTDNMAAYECVLAGKVLHHRSTREDNVEAQRDARAGDRARPEIRPCPRLEGLRARPGLGLRLVRGPRRDLRSASAKSCRSRWRSTTTTATCTASSPHCNLVQRNHDKAMYHQERALGLNPNNDLIVVQQGELLTWLGRPEDGIDWIRKAMRLNPYHPERYWNHLGRAYFVARRYRRGDRGLRPDQPRPTTRTTRSWRPPSRRWATRPRPRPTPREVTSRAARVLGRCLSRDAALQARERSRAPSRRPAQGRPEAINSGGRRNAAPEARWNVGRPLRPTRQCSGQPWPSRQQLPAIVTSVAVRCKTLWRGWRGVAVPLAGSAGKTKGRPRNRRRPFEARKVALRGILDACSSSAPSPDVGGRDQGLVRRYPTRHHDVRHWITSFPLLSLLQQMAPHCAPVKGFLGQAVRGGCFARMAPQGFLGAAGLRGIPWCGGPRAGWGAPKTNRADAFSAGVESCTREPALSCNSSASERAP